MANFELYKNMGNLRLEEVVAATGTCTWPKNKRYTVIHNGIEFKVSTYWSKGNEKELGFGYYDAYAAIESVYIPEIPPEQIRWENNGEPEYMPPKFDTHKLSYLDEDVVKSRFDFLAAVANLLNDQPTMEAIVAAAAKKKNGTLHKNRVLKLASSGVAATDSVYSLVARSKNDTTMSILLEKMRCYPGDNELWAEDFISTPHDGLRITEAIRKML